MFAKALDDAGHLRPGVSVAEARDVLWTYNSAELYHLLVSERKWSVTRFGRWIADALTAALLAEARLLVVCGLRRACVRARGGHLLPPVRPGDHLPDLPLGQIRMCRRRVRLDALNKVVVVLAGEVNLAVRRI